MSKHKYFVLDTNVLLHNPDSLTMNIADNRILAVANSLHEEGTEVIFVSKDINARLKADALGIAVMDFEKQKCNADELYIDWREASVPSEVIDKFYNDKILETAGFDFHHNEFILLQNETNPKHSALGRAIGQTASHT